MRYEPGSLAVDVELERVVDLAQWGVGSSCTQHREGSAQLAMHKPDDAAELAGYLSGIVKTEMPASSPGNIADQRTRCLRYSSYISMFFGWHWAQWCWWAYWPVWEFPSGSELP